MIIKRLFVSGCVLWLSISVFAADKARQNTASRSASATSQKTEASLEPVLSQMDAASAKFRSAQADVVWVQYQKVVNDTDIQKGRIYFKRGNKGTQMATQITSPDKKYIVFSDGKVRLYQPAIDQVTEYNTGKNREEIESFLVLGFGGRGHDLLNSYDVKFDGNETIDGVNTAKLALTPKAVKVRNIFAKIILWMDAPRGVSLKLQAIEPSGDYRTVTYTNIKLNGRISDDVFKLHTSGNTKVVRPE